MQSVMQQTISDAAGNNKTKLSDRMCSLWTLSPKLQYFGHGYSQLPSLPVNIGAASGNGDNSNQHTTELISARNT